MTKFQKQLGWAFFYICIALCFVIAGYGMYTIIKQDVTQGNCYDKYKDCDAK